MRALLKYQVRVGQALSGNKSVLCPLNWIYVLRYSREQFCKEFSPEMWGAPPERKQLVFFAFTEIVLDYVRVGYHFNVLSGNWIIKVGRNSFLFLTYDIFTWFYYELSKLRLDSVPLIYQLL